MVGSRSGAVGILAMLCLILTACFGGSSEDPGPTPGTRPQSAEPAEPTPTGGTHTSVGPAATPVDGYFGHEPVALKRGAPVALPDGVALLLTRDTGGVRSIERVVREGNELAWSTLSDGIAEVVDAAERGSNGYVYSWTASTDGTHLAALVCLAAESCWCGAPFRAGGALFVISDDAGANWRVEGPADNQVGLVGWDEAANKAVLERPLGCGTNGSGDYWLEPGHVPVAKPKQCDQACHLRLARGLGMRWRVPGGGFDSSGSSIIPAVFARKAAVWTVAAGSDPSYWEGHEADALLLYEVQGETVSRVWRTEYPYGSFGSQIGANLFLGFELRQETSRGPQNIASREWPVIYDLQTNTVHEIAGLAPVSDQAEVRLEQVIRGAP